MRFIEVQTDLPFTIGRNKDSNLFLNNTYVSHRHGVITKTDDGFLYENLSETSGTKCNGKNITKKLLEENDLLSLGIDRFVVTLKNGRLFLLQLNFDLEIPLALNENKWEFIGRRAPAKNFVIAHPACPAILAKVKRNGNAVQVLFESKVKDAKGKTCRSIDFLEKKTLSLPFCTLEMQNGQFFLRTDIPGFSVCVQNTDAYANNKKLLSNINFSLSKGEILVIIGKSGQGKSSLLNLLLGNLKANKHSTVLFNGISHKNKDIQKHIAYLSQEPELRNYLTVNETLCAAAKITLPKDTLTEEFESRKQEILELFSLQHLKNEPISTLSGGEKRRTALANELIGAPGLLLLDEPLSGLDSVNARALCHHLRKLSILGYTIILSTHGYEALDIAHKVLIIHNAKEAFFGTPKEASLYFESSTPDKALWKLKEDSSDIFESSAYYKRITEESIVTPNTVFFKTKHKNAFPLYFCILIKEFLRDKGKLTALLLQPLIIGFLFSQIFSQSSSLWIVAFALVLSANWFSFSLSVRAIVQERQILRHELRKGVSANSVLSSKLLFITLISFFQTFVCYAFLYAVLPINPSLLILLPAIILTVLPATALGLLISTICKNSGQANAILPLLIIPQVALSGVLVPLDQMRPIGYILSNLVPSKYNQSTLKALFMRDFPTCIDLYLPIILALIFYIVALFTLKRFGKAK